MRCKIFIFLIAIVLGVLTLSSPKIAKGDVVTCEGDNNTCWVFDSITSVVAINYFNSFLSGIGATGMVGTAESSFKIGVSESNDPIYLDVVNNCNKLALLAQVSPEKVALRIDTTASAVDNVVLVDVTQDKVNCSLITQSNP